MNECVFNFIDFESSPDVIWLKSHGDQMLLNSFFVLPAGPEYVFGIGYEILFG